MTIHDELTIELKAAMRERDKPRINVIRQIETEVSLAKSAPGFSGEADDELYLKTIESYVKKMDKARLEYEAAGARGRDNADKLAYEIAYLDRWLPDKLDEEQTRALVLQTIAELGADDPKMTGRVIGQVMRSGQEVDGALVNRLVREELGA
jgi:uncharacterized protein YqeY